MFKLGAIEGKSSCQNSPMGKRIWYAAQREFLSKTNELPSNDETMTAAVAAFRASASLSGVLMYVTDSGHMKLTGLVLLHQAGVRFASLNKHASGNADVHSSAKRYASLAAASPDVIGRDVSHDIDRSACAGTDTAPGEMARRISLVES